MFPGVVETHYILGGSFKVSDQNIVDIGYIQPILILVSNWKSTPDDSPLIENYPKMQK